ncbi:kinase-like domain-containing protein [Rhizophagus clarus]|uniref:Kinase-like domain-containing protein n=1 Tax=Rhizophagus clarus TaxID=94130 RepID=A0A8H3LVV7_9GLOM|nr:kinase-like domain-containing protein [Rhizophagus clarus]
MIVHFKGEEFMSFKHYSCLKGIQRNRKKKICDICNKIEIEIVSSGNEIIDNFIKNTLSNHGEMFEFVPYDKFKDLEFIAEGGFSKIYKATWTDEINYNELNEIKIFQSYSTLKHYARNNINTYFGITQNPTTQNFMIITKYYETGDLAHWIKNDFFNIDWENKLRILSSMIHGLYNIHDVNIIHKDYHSGNIFMTESKLPITGDLGLSKSTMKFTKRPKATEIYEKIGIIWSNESLNGNSTKIIKSSDIGPIATNHSGAYYKSRPLSAMISSVESTRNLRSQRIVSETVKRKFDDNLINDKIIKKFKLFPNESNDYLTKEFGFDIDNTNSNKSKKSDYKSKEINFDI